VAVADHELGGHSSEAVGRAADEDSCHPAILVQAGGRDALPPFAFGKESRVVRG
jgi:hypothetical protein